MSGEIISAKLTKGNNTRASTTFGNSSVMIIYGFIVLAIKKLCTS